jgi:hypothetical protein
MTNEQFQDFLIAVKRGSLLALDNVLPIEGMTAEQLKTLYVLIGRDYVRGLLMEALGLAVTIGDMVMYEP